MATWILKECTKCNEYKYLSSYNKQKLGKFGRRSYCRACQSKMNTNYHKTPTGKANRIKGKRKYDKTDKGRLAKKKLDAKYYLNNKEACVFRARCREAHVKIATPEWADMNALRKLYRERPDGYHVDHIVPLRGTRVCGLHVMANLQYLTAEENLSKGNKYAYDKARTCDEERPEELLPLPMG